MNDNGTAGAAQDTAGSQEQRQAPAFAWSARGWPSERSRTEAGAAEVWCYTDRFSYLPGETVDFHLSSGVAEFSLEIVRDGARPRTVFRREHLTADAHPTPEDAYAVGCGWPVGLSLEIPQDWRSGFYLVVVSARTPSGELWEREHFFVVKAPAGHRAAMALVLTTSTVLAYNDWGGANHYRGMGDDPRNDAGSPLSSTQRPIARGMLRKPAGVPRECHTHTPGIGWIPRYPAYEWARLTGYSRHHADSGWAAYERPFAVWAEEAGYEFDYPVQHDLDRDRVQASGPVSSRHGGRRGFRSARSGATTAAPARTRLPEPGSCALQPVRGTPTRGRRPGTGAGNAGAASEERKADPARCDASGGGAQPHSPVRARTAGSGVGPGPRDRSEEVVEHGGLYVLGEPAGVEEGLNDESVGEREGGGRELLRVGGPGQLAEVASGFEMRADR